MQDGSWKPSDEPIQASGSLGQKSHRDPATPNIVNWPATGDARIWRERARQARAAKMDSPYGDLMEQLAASCDVVATCLETLERTEHLVQDGSKLS